jgi:hypothetical protein
MNPGFTGTDVVWRSMVETLVWLALWSPGLLIEADILDKHILHLGKYCLLTKDKGLIVYIWSKRSIIMSSICRSCTINVYFTCLSTEHGDTDLVDCAVY